MVIGATAGVFLLRARQPNPEIFLIRQNRRTFFPQHDTSPPEALDKASTSGSNLTRQTKYRPQAENDRDARSQDGRLQKETTGALHGHFTS
jgi:hypothetical protein